MTSSMTQAGEINDKVLLFSRVGELLVTAREEGADPFAAIDAAIGWDAFQRSVTEAKALARGKDFDSLPQIRDSYAMLRRYTPDLLQTLTFKAAPAAADLLEAVDVVRELNRCGARPVPEVAPRSIIRPRWARVVLAEDGTIHRAFYEMCVLAEVRNALRSGDLWVEGSGNTRTSTDTSSPPRPSPPSPPVTRCHWASQSTSTTTSPGKSPSWNDS